MKGKFAVWSLKSIVGSIQLQTVNFILSTLLLLLSACAPMGSVRVERRITHPDGTLEVISSRLVAPKYPLEGSYMFTTTNSVEAWISSSQDASKIESTMGEKSNSRVIYIGLVVIMLFGGIAFLLPNNIVKDRDALILFGCALGGFAVVKFVESSSRVMAYVVPVLAVAGGAYLVWRWKRRGWNPIV